MATDPDADAANGTELEHALAAAAEAGQDGYAGDDIAADDVGASKLSQEVDREGKLPTSHPPGESSH